MAEYERPAMSGEAPAEFVLIDEFAETPDESVAARETSAAPAIAPQPIKAPPSFDELVAHARRHPLRFMWQMDVDGRFSLGPDEFSRLIGGAAAGGFGQLWGEISVAVGFVTKGCAVTAVPEPRRERVNGIRHDDRDARYLERHHPELAGRWRQPPARGIVRIADLRPRAEFCRLPGFWRLPRSRWPGTAGRVAPS
jgi:hypothetical protein